MPVDRTLIQLGTIDTLCSVEWENEFKTKINNLVGEVVDQTELGSDNRIAIFSGARSLKSGPPPGVFGSVLTSTGTATSPVFLPPVMGLTSVRTMAPNYTLTSGDKGAWFQISSIGAHITLPTPSALGAGWYAWFSVSDGLGLGTVQIIRTGGASFNGSTGTAFVNRGSQFILLCDGSQFFSHGSLVREIQVPLSNSYQDSINLNWGVAPKSALATLVCIDPVGDAGWTQGQEVYTDAGDTNTTLPSGIGLELSATACGIRAAAGTPRVLALSTGTTNPVTPTRWNWRVRWFS